MSSHIRRNSSLLLLALIAALTLVACGGGGTSSADVPEGAVAVVGDKTVTKEEFDKLIEEQKKSAEAQKQQYFQGDEQKYSAEIAKQGLTDEDVRNELRTRILTNKIFEAVTKKVTVSDADIKAYYDKNPTQYQQPAS